MIRLVVAFLSILAISDACSCQPTTTEEIFCMSLFVSKVRVLRKVKTERAIVITVQHQEIFKQPESLNSTSLSSKILTAPYGAACGVRLRKGKEYVLAGEIGDGHLSISVCSTMDPAFTTSEFKNINCSLPFPSPNTYSEKPMRTSKISLKQSGDHSITDAQTNSTIF